MDKKRKDKSSELLKLFEQFEQQDVGLTEKFIKITKFQCEDTKEFYSTILMAKIRIMEMPYQEETYIKQFRFYGFIESVNFLSSIFFGSVGLLLMFSNIIFDTNFNENLINFLCIIQPVLLVFAYYFKKEKSEAGTNGFLLEIKNSKDFYLLDEEIKRLDTVLSTQR